MKSFTILALAGLAVAQFNQLPTCADNQQSCANKFLTGGIGNCGSDAKCICSDKDFLSDIACCLAEPGGCDAADQSSAVVFASQLCAAQGVTVPSAVTCTSTAAGSGTAASATTTSGGATATQTSGTAANTGASGTKATDSAVVTSTPAATSGGTGTAAAGTTSSSTNYAPRESAVGAGLVGGIVAALAML